MAVEGSPTRRAAAAAHFIEEARPRRRTTPTRATTISGREDLRTLVIQRQHHRPPCPAPRAPATGLSAVGLCPLASPRAYSVAGTPSPVRAVRAGNTTAGSDAASPVTWLVAERSRHVTRMARRRATTYGRASVGAVGSISRAVKVRRRVPVRAPDPAIKVTKAVTPSCRPHAVPSTGTATASVLTCTTEMGSCRPMPSLPFRRPGEARAVPQTGACSACRCRLVSGRP